MKAIIMNKERITPLDDENIKNEEKANDVSIRSSIGLMQP